jgi:hypothetical protein
LFIGGLLFFLSAALNIFSLVVNLVKPSWYTGEVVDFFNSGSEGIIAFIILVLLIVIELFAGWYAMVYVVKGSHGVFVRTVTIVLVVFLFIDIVTIIVNEVSSKSVSWSEWRNFVYTSVPFLCYVVGYVLDKKKTLKLPRREVGQNPLFFFFSKFVAKYSHEEC